MSKNNIVFNDYLQNYLLKVKKTLVEKKMTIEKHQNLFRSTWGNCDSYNHPVVENPVTKVTLLTCKPLGQVETSNFTNLAETATGRWLESFGLANVQSEFVVEAHLLCVHGEQCRLHYRYENLNKALNQLFVEVLAMFLKWYLFEYVQPTLVLALCGPDIFGKMLEMLVDQEFGGGCCRITYKNHTIGFYGTFSCQAAVVVTV